MKLKKLLAVLLALALAMTCLVSCSKDEDKEDKEEPKRISAEETPEKEEDPDAGLEKPIESIVNFYETADGEYILDAFPAVLVEQLGDEEKDEILSMVEQYKEIVDQTDSIAVEYKIVSKEAISEEDLKTFQADLEEMVSGEKAEVTAGYLCTVELELTVEAEGEKDTETQEMEMNIYKVNGEWSIDPSSL